MPRILLALAAVALAFPAPGRADWLEVLPTCAMGDSPRRSGPAELLYPSDGLAAFAQPGESLTMRMRVPAPLTPPPGVQQERALAGWFFELEGSGAVSVSGARHRYRLRVADVRPDGHSTLVYRATVQLPPWVAPGTYDVRVRSPGSDDVRAEAAVRIGRGAPPRLGLLAELPADPGALAGLDVDIWVVSRPESAPVEIPPGSDDQAPLRAEPEEDTDPIPESAAAAPARSAVPWLDLGATFAVRVGGALLTAGGCDDAHLPFAVAVRRAGGDRLALPAAPAEGQMTVDGETAPVPTGGLVPEGPGWRNRSTRPIEVPVVFPEGARGLALAGAAARIGFWPGTPIRPHGQRASVVGLWRVAPNALVRPRELAEDSPPDLDVQIPGGPTTHQATPVRVTSNGRVALAWEEDGSAFVETPGSRAVPIHFHWLERREVHALAIGPRGAARRLATVTRVETERPSSCAVASNAPGSPGTAGGPLLLAFAALLAWRSGRFLCGRPATR